MTSIPSNITQRSLPSPFLFERQFSTNLRTVIWSKLNDITVRLIKNPKLITNTNRLVVYSLSSTVCAKVWYQCLVDCFVFAFEKIIQNLLFKSFIIGRSLQNLAVLSNFALSHRCKFCRIRSNSFKDIKLTQLEQINQVLFPNTFYGVAADDKPPSDRRFRNKLNFSLNKTKLQSPFSRCSYNFVNSPICVTNASSK